MKVVKQSSQSNKLSEISQDNKTEFALSNFDDEKKVLVQCHQFVHCRDFMIDVMVGVEENRDMGIYGFTYTKADPRPDIENASILLKLTNQGALKNFNDNIPILKTIEDGLGWATTYHELVDLDKKTTVVHALGDARWIQSALAFSWWTFLLKCMTYKIEDKANWMAEIRKAHTVESDYVDPDYFKYLSSHLNELSEQYTNFSGWTKPVNIGILHNYSGFVSLKPLIMDGKSIVHTDHVLKNWKQKCAA